VSYHAHSEPGRIAQLLAIVQGGRDLVLITDAGAPGVSDPGGELVAAAHEAGVPVVPIPGPSAVTTALQAAGLPADRYLFLGFLPRKGPERRARIAEVATSPWTVVLYEAAPRLVALLTDLEAAAGPGRTAVVARELTKLHEEIRRGDLAALRSHYEAAAPRGEITLVVAGRPAEEALRAAAPDTAEVERCVAAWLDAGESRREVARRVSAEFGMSRNDAYRLVMER